MCVSLISLGASRAPNSSPGPWFQQRRSWGPRPKQAGTLRAWKEHGWPIGALRTPPCSMDTLPRAALVLTGHLDLGLPLQQSAHPVSHDAAVGACVGAVEAANHVPGGRRDSR